jgi:hypothetical protein
MVGPLFQMLSKAFQAFNSLPPTTKATISRAVYHGTKASQRWYRNLSPENRANVEEIIRWGVLQAVKHSLPTVLGEVGEKVAGLVATKEVAEAAKHLVERGVEIGVEAALKEAEKE